MLQRSGVLLAVGALVVVASCGGGTDSDAAPLHAVPDGAQVVWGSASCRLTPPPAFLTCEPDRSDPRVSGTETIERLRMVGRQWTVEGDVITNVEGTWRGSGQGSDDEDGSPLGEAHFVGEGGYEGMEFVYYVAPPTDGEWTSRPLPLRGWIPRSTPADPA